MHFKDQKKSKQRGGYMENPIRDAQKEKGKREEDFTKIEITRERAQKNKKNRFKSKKGRAD